MKQKVMMLIVCLLTLCVGAQAQTQPSGAGTEANPYKVSNAQELLWVAGLVNGTLSGVEQNKEVYVEQTANINLSTVCSATNGSWTPIGKGENDGHFAGVYDGKGHTLSNLYISTTADDETYGLFGTVTGRVCNLTLTGVGINAPNAHFVGAVAGTVNGTDDHDLPNIENVTVTGSIVGSDKVGGLVGQGYLPHGCEMVGCTNTATVKGKYYVGGIAGNASEIRRCTNTGNVTATITSGGGIVGDCIVIKDCFNSGTISGSTVGGICGYVSNELSNVLTTGTVKGTNGQCGLISGTVNSYNLKGNHRFYASYARLALNGSTVPLSSNVAYHDYYNNRGSNDFAVAYSKAVLQSGEVAFVLQDQRSETVWGQVLDGTTLPSLQSANRVYATGTVNCINSPISATYSNTESTPTVLDHDFDGGCCSICGAYEAPEQVGSYYYVTKPTDLAWIQDYVAEGHSGVNVHVINDIDMTTFINSTAGRNWSTIGNGYDYSGTFIGHGNTIRGLTWCLFAHTNGATIHNLKVEMNGSSKGMIFNAYNTRLENCTVSGTITTSSSRDGEVGAFICTAKSCTLVECTNNATIYSNGSITGGLVGNASGLNLNKCVNNGTVFGKGSSVGGLVGVLYSNGAEVNTISNCANHGIVNSQGENVGGFFGYLWHSTLTITSCYNNAEVATTASTDMIGYLAGQVYNFASNTGNTTYLYYNADKTCRAGETNVTVAAAGQRANYFVGKAVTTAQLASGEVCYNLNGGSTSSVTWCQRLSSTSGDAYPKYIGGIVYAQGSINCLGEAVTASYSNTDGGEVTNIGHVYDDNGICIYDRTHFKEPSKNDDGMYLVGLPGELAWVRDAVNAKTSASWKDTDGGVLLTADIDLSCLCGEEIGNWIPIGYSYNVYGRTWGATFDGQGHTIRGIYVNTTTTTYRGSLFGTISGTGTVRNLNVHGDINIPDYSGMLAFQVNQGKAIQNVKAYGINRGGGGYYSAAGLVGKCFRANFVNCHNYVELLDGTLSEYSFRGGIVAHGYYSTFTACANHVNINCPSVPHVGGILGGYADSSDREYASTFTDCANYGKLTGKTHVGGIVGCMIPSGYSINATKCLNTGDLVAVDGTVAAGVITSAATTAPVVNSGNYVRGNCIVTGVNSTDGVTTTGNLTTEDGITPATVAALRSGLIARNLNGSDAKCRVWGFRGGVDIYPIPYAYDGHMFASVSALSCVCQQSHPMPNYDDDNNCYVIKTLGELLWFRDTVNNGRSELNARLEADINLSSVCNSTAGSWTPISDPSGMVYTGTFDGNGHKITGLYINQTNLNYQGLFAKIGKACVIKDLTVGGTVTARGYCGLIAGSSSNPCTISGCQTTEGSSVTATYNNGYCYAGGIIGQNVDCTITDCVNYATVSAPNSTSSNYIGGIAGRIQVANAKRVDIERCVNYGQVSTSGLFAGGIAGYVLSSPTYITDCANHGTVTGLYDVGGIAATFYGSEITNCYNVGTLSITTTDESSVAKIEGIAFSSNSNHFSNCYFLEGTAPVDSDYVGTVKLKDKLAFRGGEVAYLLGDAWGQNLDTDHYPVLGGDKVYFVYGGCSNYNNSWEPLNHNYDNGICQRCDAFEPAVLAEDEKTGETYYAIYNAGNLCWWREGVRYDNGNFEYSNARQMADIDLSPVCHAAGTGEMLSWEPINMISNWAGVYDGQNHTISNLYMEETENKPCGLFSFLGKNGFTNLHATVQNLTVEGTIINQNTYQQASCGTGLIAAYSFWGNIKNCHARGSISSTGYYVGGIVGNNRVSSITDCTNEANIVVTNPYAQAYVGGIVGAGSGQILRCVNKGNVTASNNWYVGGITGSCSVTVSSGFEAGFEDNANLGTITGQNALGGVVGVYGKSNPSEDPASVSLPMRRCWNVGSVVPTNENTGYLNITPGRNGGADIEDCYYNSTIATIDDVSKLASKGYDNWDVTPKTTAQFSSGEVAYLLGGLWGQNIDLKAPYDTTPVLGGPKVYLKRNGTGYTNISPADVDANGIVTIADIARAVRDHVDVDGNGVFDTADIDAIANAILEISE